MLFLRMLSEEDRTISRLLDNRWVLPSMAGRASGREGRGRLRVVAEGVVS